MTPIEQQALALINEVALERGASHPSALLDRAFVENEVICRLIERHEAFKQEVSKELVEAGYCPRDKLTPLARFILPKPADPLVEAMQDAAIGAAAAMGLKLTGYNVEQEAADRLRKALAARGLKIVEDDA